MRTLQDFLKNVYSVICSLLKGILYHLNQVSSLFLSYQVLCNCESHVTFFIVYTEPFTSTLDQVTHKLQLKISINTYFCVFVG